MADIITITPDDEVLRNRGYRIRLHRLVTDDSGAVVLPARRAKDNEGDYQFEHRWFKLTNKDLAEFEQPEPYGFGGLEPMGEKMDSTPVQVVSRVLAVVFELYMKDATGVADVPDWRAGALLMEDGEVMTYALAVSAALQVAQGQNPKDVAESLRKMLAKKDEEIKKAAADIDDTLTSQAGTSLGRGTSETGQPSTDPGTSSGD